MAIKDDHIPYDDEPLTKEDLEEVKKAEAEYRRGQTTPFEEIDDE